MTTLNDSGWYTRDVIRRLAIFAILAIALGAPMVEAFDRWDETLRDGNDTEATVVIAALCVGMALAVGTVVIAPRLCAVAPNARVRRAVARIQSVASTLTICPTPTVSPPSPLRL